MKPASPIVELLSLIQSRHRFLLVSHARPDGDAIGSVLAFSMLLDQLGKHSEIVLADRVPVIYRHLPQVSSIRHAADIDGDYDAVILLECDSLERTGLHGLDKPGRLLINIDHHASGKQFADFNWIDTEACAVAAMVYQFACYAASVTPAMASCLYTAVLTDTGSFCYPGVDDSTFCLAQELVRKGANAPEIAREIYFSNPVSKIRLLGAALANLNVEGPIAWAWVTQQDMNNTHAAEEDCEGVVNYAIGIAGVTAAVFLRELPDGQWRLSLRSKGALNVARVAESFGGGGHTNASGCTLPGPLSAAAERILSALSSALNEC